MREFRYERATDVSSAVGTIAGSPNGAFLAAGTNLVDNMRLGIATPELLVDIRQLTSDQITELPDGGIRIGAAVRNSDRPVSSSSQYLRTSAGPISALQVRRVPARRRA